MRTSIGLLGLSLLLNVFNASAAPADLKEMCEKDGSRDLCLKGLVNLRCYALALPDFERAQECTKSANALVTALDLLSHTIELPGDDGKTTTQHLAVIFRNTLDRLISDSAAQTWLQNLMTDLRRASRDATAFNLWDYTVTAAKGDEALALEWIAVLIQDTSRTKIQIFYLQDRAKREKMTPAELLGIENLQVIQELIRAYRFRDPGSVNWLTLYPRVAHLNEDLNVSPYHFYTMAFTARMMKKAGASDIAASFLPFLFNSEYEFRTLDPEAWPLKLPRPFPITEKQSWMLQDLYAGLTGPLWSIGMLDRAEVFSSFREGLAENPKSKMREVLFLLDSN